MCLRGTGLASAINGTEQERRHFEPLLALPGVLRSGISCQLCFRTAEEKQCGFNRCMQLLKPDVVYNSVERVIRLDGF